MNLYNYLKLLYKWKKFLTINLISILILSIIVAFILPKWYKSTASIKPIAQNNVSFFSSILAGAGLASVGKSFNIGGLQYSDLDYYTFLLQSRSVSMKMIRRYDLKNRYDKEYYFKTIEELNENSLFQQDPTSNTLGVSVLDTDSLLAQKMVYSYLEFLSEILDSLKDRESITTHSMIEKRFEKNKIDLEKAENNLKLFQEKYNIVLPEEQFINTVSIMSELESHKLFLETQIDITKVNQGENAPSTKSLELQLSSINNKIESINNGKSKNNLLVSYKFAPELINKYIKLYREITIQSKLLEMIYPLLEESRLNQESESPNFLIIDKPEIPEYKDKPKRVVVILVGTFLGMFLSLSYIFMVESYKKVRENILNE